MEGAPGLVAGGEVLRCGGMEVMGKTGELLDASGVRRPRWAPRRRRRAWAEVPRESLWSDRMIGTGERRDSEEEMGISKTVKKPCT